MYTAITMVKVNIRKDWGKIATSHWTHFMRTSYHDQFKIITNGKKKNENTDSHNNYYKTRSYACATRVRGQSSNDVISVAFFFAQLELELLSYFSTRWSRRWLYQIDFRLMYLYKRFNTVIDNIYSDILRNADFFLQLVPLQP